MGIRLNVYDSRGATGGMLVRRGRILVASIEATLSAMVEVAASFMGHSVVSVETGEDAIREYKNCLTGDPFDFVVFDPDACGISDIKEYLDHLRRVDPKVKAVIAVENDRTEHFYSGFDYVITRRCSIDDIQSVIVKVMNS
jgi:hypothetical protein